MTVNSSLQNYRINDPVITTVVHGYVQADSIAPFVAPAVPVSLRAGKVIRFGKEQFAVLDTRRMPGSRIKRVTVDYEADSFFLQQHAIGAEVVEEAYQEAANGAAKQNLRILASKRASNTLMQSWEDEVIRKITDPTKYEATCTTTLSGTSLFSNPDSDPEIQMQDWKESVRAQIGVYPNSAIIGAKVLNTLRRHEMFRDRIKYTSSGSINLDMLAAWFDLPRGIRVSKRLKLDAATNTLVDMWGNDILLFYGPETGFGDGLVPVSGADRETPAFAYTYTLNGYPIGTTERFDEDRRVFVTDIITEQAINLVGMGGTNKIGSAFLAKGVI